MGTGSKHQLQLWVIQNTDCPDLCTYPEEVAVVQANRQMQFSNESGVRVLIALCYAE